MKWSPDTVAATASGTMATWFVPLKEKINDESEEGRVGSAAVQLAAGEGGGSRSASPLNAPGRGEEDKINLKNTFCEHFTPMPKALILTC